MPVYRRKSVIAVVAVLLCALALPASAHSVPIDTTISCPPSTPSAGFTDLAGLDTTTQTAINCIFAFGISRGVTDSAFNPHGAVTRQEMAFFMIRQATAHGLTIPSPVDQGFTDIAGLPLETQNAINRVTQMGISTGTSETTFSPNQFVTRWQMALFLYRLAQQAGVSFTPDPTGVPFTDIGAYSPDIRTAIDVLANGHIVVGTSEGIFSGDLFVLRWQMALFITRVLAADGITQP
ncbi:MAG: S-layer homology domain-containing protein [Acidimicrobiia bacterium]